MSDIAPANERSTDINPDPVHDAPRPPGALGLFLVFNQIALCGFGGTLPWAYRILVERRKLLTQKEFTETLALGQILFSDEASTSLNEGSVTRPQKAAGLA